MPVTKIDAGTALVLIDVQNATVGAPCVPHSGSDVVTRSALLADAFREHGATVVLVRVTQAEDHADGTPGRKDAPSYIGTMPAGWDEIVEDLKGHPGDILVTKRNWGAFYGTDLDLQLRRRGITQVVLAGIATSIGVESTARNAHELGYHVTLATDAMSDMHPEAHRNSIERIFPLLGECGTSAEIIEVLAKSR